MESELDMVIAMNNIEADRMDKAMTNNPESVGKTPRTDAIFRDLYGRKIEAHEAIQIATEWAEQLETELSVLTERIAGLEREFENYKQNTQGILEAWEHQYKGEKERGDLWMTDCKAAELALSRANAALEELYAMVKGECPSLLNEDSGGCARLAMQISECLASGKPDGC